MCRYRATRLIRIFAIGIALFSVITASIAAQLAGERERGATVARCGSGTLAPGPRLDTHTLYHYFGFVVNAPPSLPLKPL